MTEVFEISTAVCPGCMNFMSVADVRLKIDTNLLVTCPWCSVRTVWYVGSDGTFKYILDPPTVPSNTHIHNT